MVVNRALTLIETLLKAILSASDPKAKVFFFLKTSQLRENEISGQDPNECSF